MYLVEPGVSIIKPSNGAFLTPNKNLFHEGIHEIRHINWAEQFLTQDKDFIDVGAHVGTWSWNLAPKCRKTYAFEPNRRIYNMLCGNIAIKNLDDKIETYNIGLSAKKEKLPYYDRKTDGGGNGFTYLGKDRDPIESDIKLNVTPLDEYGFDKVGFMKIDVEGHEIEVLKGAIETLENNNYPRFVFESWIEWREFNEHHVPAFRLRKELFEYIKSLEYKILPVAGNSEMFLAQR